MPTEAVQHVRRMRGGAQAQLMRHRNFLAQDAAADSLWVTVRHSLDRELNRKSTAAMKRSKREIHTELNTQEEGGGVE